MIFAERRNIDGVRRWRVLWLLASGLLAVLHGVLCLQYFHHILTSLVIDGELYCSPEIILDRI